MLILDWTSPLNEKVNQLENYIIVEKLIKKKSWIVIIVYHGDNNLKLLLSKPLKYKANTFEHSLKIHLHMLWTIIYQSKRIILLKIKMVLHMYMHVRFISALKFTYVHLLID